MVISDTRKYAIYSRKSKFTGKGESIDNQISKCKEYLRFHFNIKGEDSILIFEDEGFSGKNTNRPQFQLMMDACKKQEIKVIICYQLDRISRSVKDFSILIDELIDLNISFVSVKESFDTSTPMGKAMMMITSVFAQMERENLAERLKDNFQTLAKSGHWLGGTTPTGYKSTVTTGSIASNGKIRKAYMLEPIPEESRTIQKIFSMYLETNSLTMVEKRLQEEHINTRNNIPFKCFAIKNILRNPVYASADEIAWDYFHELGTNLCFDKSECNSTYGIMAYNKSNQTSGIPHDIKEYEAWIIAIGKHTPLISGKEWVKVQKMLDRNASKNFRKPRNNQALLSGLIFCGHCGNKMRPKLGHSTRPDGTRSFNYLCETKEKTRQKNCAIKNAPGNLLDETVCNEIKKLAEDDSTFMKQWKETKKVLLSKGNAHIAELKSLKISLSEKDKQINNLLLSLAESADSPAHAYIQERINSIHIEKVQLEKRIKELSELSDNQSIMLEAELEFVPKMLVSFSQSFDSMSIEEKRSALRLFIDKVVWNGETVDLYLMGSSDTSLSKVSRMNLDGNSNHIKQDNTEPLQRGSQN